MILVAAVVVLTVAGAAMAKGGESPWDAIREAVADLQEQIDNIELTPGPEGPAGPVLHLVDDDGQDLGIFIEMSNPARTYVPSLDVFVRLNANFSNRQDSGVDEVLPFLGGSIQLSFEGADCTGQAFFSQAFHHQRLMKASSSDGFRYFKTRRKDVPESRTKESEFVGHFSETLECENVDSETLSETFAYDEIFLPFTEPLAPPLEIKPL